MQRQTSPDQQKIWTRPEEQSGPTAPSLFKVDQTLSPRAPKLSRRWLQVGTSLDLGRQPVAKCRTGARALRSDLDTWSDTAFSG